MDKYILKGHEPVICNSLMTWSSWFETANRHVDFTIIDDVKISTVFLGLDHNYFNKGNPILFETMIFGGKFDEYQDRCSTWEQAEKMHLRAVIKVENNKS